MCGGHQDSTKFDRWTRWARPASDRECDWCTARHLLSLLVVTSELVRLSQGLSSRLGLVGALTSTETQDNSISFKTTNGYWGLMLTLHTVSGSLLAYLRILSVLPHWFWQRRRGYYKIFALLQKSKVKKDVCEKYLGYFYSASTLKQYSYNLGIKRYLTHCYFNTHKASQDLKEQ